MIGYTDEAALQSYADARGIVLNKPLTQLLTLGLDYIESFEPEFDGDRLDQDQPLAWPRTITQGVPLAIGQAQIIAAVEIDKGVNLLNTQTGGQVKRKKTGPLEKEYFSPVDMVATVPQIDALLSPFKRGSGFFLSVVRV